MGYLDDVVALQINNTILVRQVKYSTNSEDPDDPWTWERLLERTRTKRGELAPSLLQKWSVSFLNISKQWQEVDPSVFSNRRAAPEISQILTNRLLDFDRVQDPQLRREIIDQIGDERTAINFFKHFKFYLDQPGLDELEDSLRRKFDQLGGTETGWFNLGKELRSWVIHRLEPAPDGKIRLLDIKKAALWYSLQSLPQRFEIPADYVLPSEEFHQQILNSIIKPSEPCLVVTASPGVGKSTYVSYLYESLQKAGVPVVRHHYYLSVDDRNRVIRLDHQRAAESLMHDLLRDYPESISTVGERNPNAGDLTAWLEAAGKYYSEHDQFLVLLIDGLDHVWREQKSIRELEDFLNMVLPPQSGLIVLLATQPIEDNKLPRCLLRSAPRSEWFRLPLLSKPSVQTWINYHADEIAENNGDHIPEWKVERLADALYKKSKGHPLHLRYSLRSLLERNQLITEDTISELPECVHDEIVHYYEELWAILPEESREILHLIAACPFPWPRDGIFACMDPDSQRRSLVRRNLTEVNHLLYDSEMGLQVFHSSLLTFIANTEAHVDYAIYVKRKALTWLGQTAPTFWKWAYEWLLQADLGNEDPIFSGPGRHWAIEALAKRHSFEDINLIIDRSIKVALSCSELPRAVELGLLHDYCNYAYDFQQEVVEKILLPQLLLEEDPYLRQRLRSNLEKLSDKELATLAIVESLHSNKQFVKRIIDELIFRFRHPRDDGHFSPWTEKLRPVVETFALPGSAEPERVVNLALRNRENGLTYEMLAIYSKRLRALKQSEALRTLLNIAAREDEKEEADKQLNNHEKEIILREAILLALEENLDIDREISYWETSSPLNAVYRYIRHLHHAEVREYALPSPSALFEKSYDIATQNSSISNKYRFVFHCFIADALLGASSRNTRWLKEVGEYTWARSFVHVLHKLALDSATILANGQPISIGWVYDQLLSFPRPNWLENRDESEFIEASVPALQIIAFDLFAISNAMGYRINITVNDITKVFDSSYCIKRQWVTIYLDQERIWMTEDTVQWIINNQQNEFENTIEEFPTRAEAYSILAHLAVTHGFLGEAQEFVRRAAENLIAHFHHKDMIINEALDVIEICQPLFKSLDEESILYTYLLQFAPAIAEIHSFTDGDETGHLPNSLADTLAVVKVSKLPDYYLWLCSIDEPDDALHVLHTFIKNIDLTDPIAQAIAKTAIDDESLSIISELVGKNEPGADEVLGSLYQVAGKYVKLKDYYKDSSSPSQKTNGSYEEEALLLGDYPPERGVDFFSELNNRRIIYRDEKITAWIDYWVDARRGIDAFRAMEEIVEKGFYFHGYDRVFELCLELFGKDEAYPWLIKAQNKESGWFRYHTSEEDAQKRWRIVKELYPERWFDFIQRTFSYGSLTLFRLVEYLIFFEQFELVKKLLSKIIACVLEYTSPSQFSVPEWVKDEQKEN